MRIKSLLLVIIVLGAVSVSAGEPKKVSMKKIKKDIMARPSGSWTDSSKMAVFHFIEKIKTAYENKDSDYLAKTFESENYLRYKKEEKDFYIQQLKECFKSKNKIKVSFYFCDVRKLGRGGESFGMNLQIEYKCKKIKDKGYLFALLDINDPQEYVKVWVWQKERDPKINSNFDKDDPFYGLYYGGHFD